MQEVDSDGDGIGQSEDCDDNDPSVGFPITLVLDWTYEYAEEPYPDPTEFMQAVRDILMVRRRRRSELGQRVSSLWEYDNPFDHRTCSSEIQLKKRFIHASDADAGGKATARNRTVHS